MLTKTKGKQKVHGCVERSNVKKKMKKKKKHTQNEFWRDDTWLSKPLDGLSETRFTDRMAKALYHANLHANAPLYNIQ